MSARDHVLGTIRRRLGRPVEDSAHVEARIADHPAGPLPAIAQGDPAALRARFVEQARLASADVAELDAPGALPALVAGLCGESGFDPRAVLAPDPGLTRLDWKGAGVTAEAGRAGAHDRVCVSCARCAVAETGTLVLSSGADSPVTLGFLPDVHVVLLHAGTIVGSYEEAWDVLRARGPMPRTVNWITGPSRSADIEQTLQLGAHGPVRLVVALLDGASATGG